MEKSTFIKYNIKFYILSNFELLLKNTTETFMFQTFMSQKSRTIKKA